jgi:cell division protein FtsB
VSTAPPPSGRSLVRPSGPGGRSTAARSPFVLLVVVLLAGGLISLLLLNAAVNQDSFALSKLEKQTDQLRDEEQALQQEVDEYSAPGALDKRARELGMVPGGNPAFLSPDGTVHGDPAQVAPPPTPAFAPAEAPVPAGASAPAEAPAPGGAPVSAGVRVPGGAPVSGGASTPSPSAGASAQETP